MRFTIDEYSKEFKMSKELVQSRLKSKKLNYIIEDGVTYIIVSRRKLDEDKRQDLHEKRVEQKQREATLKPKPKTTAATVISLYQKENAHLKQKIKELESKIDKLIDDKERMLIQERERIESVYAAKDEQLKTILDLINTKLLLTQESSMVHDVQPSEPQSEDKEADIELNSKIIDLKSYLKQLNLSSDEKKIIKKRFAKAYGNDVRVLAQNGQIFLDFSQYDYSDLFAL